MRTLICSTARSVGWRSASALYTHSEWLATFFSSTEQGKGQQDVQTVVSLLVNSWPFGTVFSRRLPGGPQAGLALPTPTPPLTPGLLSGNKKHWCSLSETNPDFLGLGEAKWHCCPSAPEFWSLEGISNTQAPAFTTGLSVYLWIIRRLQCTSNDSSSFKKL